MTGSPLRVLAVMEATSVTGPAKNLIRFGTLARPHGVVMEVATFVRHAPENGFTEAVRAAGLTLYSLQERGRWDRNVAAGLVGVVEQRRPALLQTHGVKSHFLARWTGLYRRLPWIAFHHGYTAEDWKQRAYNLFDRYSLPAAAHVVAVCRPFADALARRGVSPAKLTVLANAIDGPPAAESSEIDALRQEFPCPGRTLLAVGRLSYEKGYDILLEAVALARTQMAAVPFQLIVVGDGPERARLEAQSVHLGLADVVRWAGFRPRVGPFFALADGFVLPSRSEGSPNALLEAMAAGVPAIASAVGGVPDTIEQGTSGWLVPPESPATLAGAILELLLDPESARARAAAARHVVEMRFTPEAYRASLTALYWQLVGQRG